MDITETREKTILIMGKREELRSLGEMLLLKAKLGKNLSCTFTDGINKPIDIQISEKKNESDISPAMLQAARTQMKINREGICSFLKYKK